MLIFKGLALTVLGGASVGPFPQAVPASQLGLCAGLFNITFVGGPFNLLALMIGARRDGGHHLFQLSRNAGTSRPMAWPKSRTSSSTAATC